MKTSVELANQIETYNRYKLELENLNRLHKVVKLAGQKDSNLQELVKTLTQAIEFYQIGFEKSELTHGQLLVELKSQRAVLMTIIRRMEKEWVKSGNIVNVLQLTELYSNDK